MSAPPSPPARLVLRGVTYGFFLTTLVGTGVFGGALLLHEPGPDLAARALVVVMYGLPVAGVLGGPFGALTGGFLAARAAEWHRDGKPLAARLLSRWTAAGAVAAPLAVGLVPWLSSGRPFPGGDMLLLALLGAATGALVGLLFPAALRPALGPARPPAGG